MKKLLFLITVFTFAFTICKAQSTNPADMEDESLWSILEFSSEETQLTFTFNYTDSIPVTGEGGCLRVQGEILSEVAGNGLATNCRLYRPVTVGGGRTYTINAAFRDMTLDSVSNFWIEIGLSTVEPTSDSELEYIMAINTWRGCGPGLNGNIQDLYCRYEGQITIDSDVSYGSTYYIVFQIGQWNDTFDNFDILLDNIEFVDLTPPTLVTSISLSSEENMVEVNDSLQISANISPSSADIQEVDWSVTNGTGEATINASGMLTGMKAGTVTVVATAMDESGVTGSKEIEVISSFVSVSSITITSSSNEVAKYDTLQMGATIEPVDASNKDIEWSVVNGTGRASIGSGGLLRGLVEGDVTVIATATDGSGISGYLTINVIPEVSVDDFSSPEFTVWPNPSKGVFNIKSGEKNSALKVLDLTGKILFSGSFDEETLLDLTSYKSANYILQVSTSGYTNSVLLSVQK